MSASPFLQFLQYGLHPLTMTEWKSIVELALISLLHTRTIHQPLHKLWGGIGRVSWESAQN